VDVPRSKVVREVARGCRLQQSASARVASLGRVGRPRSRSTTRWRVAEAPPSCGGGGPVASLAGRPVDDRRVLRRAGAAQGERRPRRGFPPVPTARLRYARVGRSDSGADGVPNADVFERNVFSWCGRCRCEIRRLGSGIHPRPPCLNGIGVGLVRGWTQDRPHFRGECSPRGRGLHRGVDPVQGLIVRSCTDTESVPIQYASGPIRIRTGTRGRYRLDCVKRGPPTRSTETGRDSARRRPYVRRPRDGTVVVRRLAPLQDHARGP